MKSVIGNNIIFSLFGESHSELMGITIHNLPSGLKIDEERITRELQRRRPDENLSNARFEDDKYQIISGLFNSFTTGAPLTIIVNNKNCNSQNYTFGLVRPSHADYPAYVRSRGYNDYRGGGSYSGRLTVLLVIAGTICKELLETQNIKIGSHIKSIGNICDEINEENFGKVFSSQKMVSSESFEKVKELVKETMKKKDSLGGVIEAFVSGLPVGVGEPFFDSLESVLSHYIFSIPGVKGVTFGSALEMAKGYGSNFSDELKYENDKIIFRSNHNGGINGGLSNGNLLTCCAYFKPTPTIGLPLQTVNMNTKENITYEFAGRHDTCYALRCDVILESVLAMGILDLYLSMNVWNKLWKED